MLDGQRFSEPDRRGDREFDAVTVAVVNAMNAGLKDEAAARKLSVSLRTYRRYVAEAMAGLGVATRFQLGVRAAELGMLSGARSVSRTGIMPTPV